MRNAFLLTPESTLHQAINALDATGIGFLAFIDDKGYLIGILTDGDLRRGMLNNKTALVDFINEKPITIPVNTTKENIIAKLKALHRRHMPLTDENNVFKGVFSLDDIDFISKDNLVVIMAGGLGSRLGELTKDIPKPMLNVGNKPMIQHLVEQFRDQGFRRFVFCLNYKKEAVIEYFGNGDEFGVKIDYLIEEQRMGTAGALSLMSKIPETPFFVINADVLTNVDFNALLTSHIKNNSMATMCVRKFEQQVPYGVIITDDTSRITGITEKPSYSFNINAGVYVLSPKILSSVPKDEFFDMPTLFEQLISNELLCSTFNVNDYWLDIGRKADFYKANNDLTLIINETN